MRSRPPVSYVVENLYCMIHFLNGILGLSLLRSRNDATEDQKPVVDSRIEANATALEVIWDPSEGDTREVAKAQASTETSPCRTWAQVGEQWWFLGDDNELEMTSCDARPSNFLRSFIPNWLRKFGVLQLDIERLLWVFCAEQTTVDDNFANCRIPYYICGLPVVVMLPRSPCQVFEQHVLDKVRIDPTCAIKAEDLNSLWDAFPFATGICIWMSGHIQLLAPHLSNAEIAKLGIPSHAAGLQVSISRWSPAPTAADSDHFPQQPRSVASLTNVQGSNFLSNKRNADTSRHPQSAVNGHGPHDDSALTMKPSRPPTPTTLRSSSHQLVPASRSLASQQIPPGSVLPQSTYTLPTNFDPALASNIGRSLGCNSRLKIGNTISTAGVKVKMSSGPFAGRAFLSASTHAVFEGKTGKRLRTRSVPNKKRKKKKKKNPFAKFFSSTPTPEAIAIAEVEVSDLHGNMIGKTVGSMVYDSHPIPTDALFPDALPHDLCFVGPLPEPTIRFEERTSKLSWYQGNQLPLGCGVAILDDPDNSEGRSFHSGVSIQKSISVRDGKRAVLLEKDVVDSTILFRRQAMPLEGNQMSGAAVVTKGDDHRWNKVVGFQSFQFVPPEAAYQVEPLWDESFLENIRLEKTLICCICGARPVPQILKSQMEIINDEPLP